MLTSSARPLGRQSVASCFLCGYIRRLSCAILYTLLCVPALVQAVQMEGIPAPPRWITTWKPCKSDTPVPASERKFTIHNATASPGSFAGRTGHSGAIRVFSNISTTIDGGTVYRQGSRDGNAGFLESFDLCEWLEHGCPLEAGVLVSWLSKRSKVPWYAPEGTYVYTYRAVDKRKKPLFCIEVTVQHRCTDGSVVCAGLPLA